MILSEKVIEQAVDRTDRARFVKQLVMVEGPVPLAMVRKRSCSARGATGGSRGPLLLIHGYGQNRYAWHLPLRSLSGFLARAGYDVFNLDLRGHGRSAHLGASRPVTTVDYVREDVPTAVEQIQKITGSSSVFLVGHSLGGLVSYAAAPGLGSAARGVVAIGSPYHFLQGLGRLSALGAVVHFLENRVSALEGDLAMDHRIFGEVVRSFQLVINSPLSPLPFRGYDPSNIETAKPGVQNPHCDP